MTTISKLEVELDLSSGQFTGKMTQAGRVVQVFGRNVDDMARSVKNTERHVTSFTSKVRDLFVILGQARGAMHTLWGVTGSWAAAIVKAAGELERLQKLMEGVSKSTDATQRRLEGMASMKFNLDLAKNAPFEVEQIAHAFVKLKAGGIDPVNGSLQSLVDAVAHFGGDSQILNRASIAIQQMAGKGVISMEELRQQLGEAVPNAMQLMARGMGMSMAQLVQEISKGRVAAQPALQALFREFELEFKGSAEGMMNTWTGLTARLKTEFMLFAKDVGDAGFMDALKKGVQDLLDLAKDPEFKRFAVDFGKGLGSVITGFADLVKWAVHFRDELRMVAMVWAGMKLGQLANTALQGLGSLLVTFGSLRQKIAETGLAMAAARTSGAGLAGVISAMGGPIGIAVVAIGALAAAWYESSRQAEAARQAYKDFKDELANGGAGSMEGLQELTSRMTKLSELTKAYGKSRMDTMLVAKEDLRKFVTEELQLEFDENDVRGSVAKAQAAVDAQMKTWRTNSLRESVKRGSEIFEKQLSEGGQAAILTLRGKMAEFDRALNDAGGSKSAKGKGVLEQRAEAIKTAYGSVVGELSEMEKQAKLAFDRLKDGTDPAIAQQFKERWVKAQEAVNAAVKRRDELLNDQKGPTLLNLPTQKDQQAQNSALEFIANLKGNIAELTAKLNGSNSELDEFEAKIKTGDWMKGLSPERVKEVEGLITRLHDLKIKWKEKTQAEQDAAKVSEFLSQKKAELSESLEQEQTLLKSGAYDEGAGGLARLNRQLARERDLLPQTTAELTKFDAEADRLRGIAANIDLTKFARQTEEMKRGLAMDMAPNAHARNQMQFEREMENIRAYTGQFTAGSQERARAEEEALKRISVARQRFAWEDRTQLQQMLDGWGNLTDRMDEWSTKVFSDFSSGMADMVMEGKANFKDLAKSLIKDLIRIMIQALITRTAMSFMGGMGGAAASTTSLAATTGAGFVGPAFASGGVMTGGGPVPLRKYAKGGIAKSPQLALFGEGSKPEAYVPLPDGRSIPVSMKGGQNVTVNIINESGNKVEGEQKGTRFDGSGMILDVVLRAVNKPGSFRDGMKGALAR